MITANGTPERRLAPALSLELNDLGTLRGQDGGRAGSGRISNGFYLEPEKEATMDHSSRMRA
jgi:hypothetical protein